MVRIIKNCQFCHERFNVKRKAQRFCSISCSTKRQYKENPNYGFQKGHRFRFRNGLVPWNKGKPNPELSKRQKENNVSKRPEVRKKMSEARTRFYLNGGHPPNWRGGHSKNRKYQNKIWFELRKKIYERDDWTCQRCGKKGGLLNAHHIIPWSEDPELALEKDNIITLCVPCHTKIHYPNNLAPLSKGQEVSQ